MNTHVMECVAVESVLDELLGTRETRGVSGRWLAALESVLCRFSEFAPASIGDITPADCDAFLARLDVGPRGRNNAIAMLRQLFRFAIRRRYLPADFLPMATLERSLVRAPSVSLYTAHDAAKLLAVASPALRAVIVLTGFCGVRSAEAQRLHWSEVDIERGHVFVSAEKAKTAGRRVCPIPGNAREWLKACRGEEAGIWPGTLHQHGWAFREAHRISGVEPKRNGLRHSFISYRLTEVMDAQRVALEAGTSPQMIFSNYRELVTAGMAAEWFELSPDSELELVA